MKRDGRKMDHRTLEEIRKMAVEWVREGERSSAVTASYGFHRCVFIAGCTSGFWAAYDQLPAEIRHLADQRSKILKQNPRHPSLHFKKVGRYWLVRVGLLHFELESA